MIKLIDRILPLGAIPYTEERAATRMVAKLCSDLPGLFMLPKISSMDNILNFTLSNIPWINFQDGRYYIKTETKVFLHSVSDFEKAFEFPSEENLSKYASESEFLDKYLKIIKKFHPKNACFELWGPISLSYVLINENKKGNERLIISQKNYRKLLVEIICIKAMYMINKIKAVSPNTVPIVILNEPNLNICAELERKDESVTVKVVTGILTKIVNKLKSEGAMVAVHSASKCDWKIPINAGVDMISFDAYKNPHNLSIIPEQIIEFIVRGGKINFSIVPTTSESVLKSMTVDLLEKKFTSIVEDLTLSGVPTDFIYDSALVSTQEHMEHLPIIFAEKALILANQLSKRISTKL